MSFLMGPRKKSAGMKKKKKEEEGGYKNLPQTKAKNQSKYISVPSTVA